MQKDLRGTALYEEAHRLYASLRQPGTGLISDAAEVHASPDGAQAVFAGVLTDSLEGAQPTRICQVDLASAQTRVLTFGPNTDRSPKYSPDGRRIAFLSDRRKAGDFQLYLLDPSSGAARAAPAVEGWIEYLQWSADGRHILLGVAGHGADVAGGQGAVTSKPVEETLPPWTPAVEAGEADHQWRSAWVYEVAAQRVRRVSRSDINVWEAAWCGSDALAVVASPGPGEGLWYSARLQIVEIEKGLSREIFTPRDQIGWPSASPSGHRLAVVEAICSDRWIVAGELRLIDTASGNTRLIDTRDVDVSYTEWRSDRCLLLAGHRGLETVVGLYDADSQTYSELWASRDITSGGVYAALAGLNDAGDCVIAGEGFRRAPEIAVIRRGEYRTVKSFDHGYADQAKVIGSIEQVSWQAPDGLEMQGVLLRPAGAGPHPTVMCAHGGPVWHWRPLYLGRRGVSMLMLLDKGYAVFLPNPRGSSGRGRAFVQHVLGEMGGADTDDLLTGIDHLVERGLADPKRLGVTGVSYGGFMTSWLITQDSRFAAAVSISPVTHQVTEHLLSNIPHFVSLFLADSYTNPGGKYFTRSPIMHAHRTQTPTLNICGALDRCTPPQEAMQFHRVLQENGVTSALVTYPEEGHGVRKFPAAIDYAARIVAWFREHMPATPESEYATKPSTGDLDV